MSPSPGAAWGALGLLGFALGAWTSGAGRGGPALTGLALIRGAGPAGAGLVLLAGAALVAASLLALAGPGRRIGRSLAAVAALGLVAALVGLGRAPGPAGWGALATTVALANLTGLGIGRGRLVRGGAFVGAAIVWMAVLVALFILYPVVAMLHASVASGSGLTAAYLSRTLRSPVFLLLSHETLPRPASAVALAGAALAGLLGLDTGVFFGPLGVAIAQVMAFTPIAFLVLSGVVRSLDVALEEAAQTLRATPWVLLRTVTGPLLVPGLANAMLLVMIESLADFGNPILLGGGTPFLATEVFLAIEGRFDPHEAAVYGVVLLALALALFLVQRRWLAGVSVVTVTGRPSAGRPVPLPRVADWTLTGLFLVYATMAALLYGSLFLGGFVRVWGIDHTFTTTHYRDMVTAGLPVLLETARLAAIAAVPAALIGFLIAYLTTRHRFLGRGALEFSALLSYALPGTVMGVGYILAFNQGGFRLTGTSAILIAAFVFRGMPVGVRSGMAALAQVDPVLEEASAMLRASVPATLRRVVLPLVLPALLTGFIYCFVRAVTAVSQVIFLVSPGHDLATVLLLSWAEYGHLGRGAALASVLVVLLAAVVLPVERFGRRSPRPGPSAAT